MEIIPVIYIHKGKTVSFYKGDKAHETIYPKSPHNYAEIFASYGAKIIQLVDKDGQNRELIQKIIQKNPQVKFQLAAKIRTQEALKEAFATGAEKVIIGVAGKNLIAEAIQKYGADRILAGIKGKNRMIITSENIPSDTEVIQYAETLGSLGVTNLIYHDVWSEGTMINPNYDEIERLHNLTNLNIYSSGGISEMKHLSLLEKTGAKGALIGKALYERAFNLERLFV